MCTLTLVPLENGHVRLGFNRDELRSRPVALPPQRRRFGRHDAILPVDPLGGGTWLALNDMGLALAILNVNLPAINSGQPYGGLRSRGAIIADLVSCDSLDAVVESAGSLNATAFAPFRLVALSAGVFVEFYSDGQCVRPGHGGVVRTPRMFTSSGLGDHLVAEPRRRLFDEMFTDVADRSTQQTRFHQHYWPGREHLSVCMSRNDACTVSYTTLEFNGTTGGMTYFPGRPDRSATPTLARITFPKRSGR